jgi:hypothetical protein
MIVGCDDDRTDCGIDPALNGTWIDLDGWHGIELKFNNGNYQEFVHKKELAQGRVILLFLAK